MSNVTRFPGITNLDLDPDMILSEAIGKLATAIIIGTDKDGELYFASSVTDGGTVLWWVELAKKALLEVGA